MEKQPTPSTTAGNENAGAAFYLILWGTILFLFSFFQYLGLVFPESWIRHLAALSWIVFPIGGLLSYIKSKKEDAVGSVKSPYDNLYMYVWGGVGLCLGAVSLLSFSNQTGYDISTTILLFGFAAFITGGVSKFSPSIAGGVICIILAAISLKVAVEVKYLLGAFGMIASCVVPGMMMKKAKMSS